MTFANHIETNPHTLMRALCNTRSDFHMEKTDKTVETILNQCLLSINLKIKNQGFSNVFQGI